MTPDTNKPANSSTLTGIAGALIAGFVVIVLLSAGASSVGHALATAGTGLGVAGAASMVGGFLGFLFGIPRSLQAGDAPASGPAKTIEGMAPEPSGGYRVNTNLEQISDWLTKILVGVGLTQLNVLPDKLQALAAFLAPSFPDVAHADVIAIALVLYFWIGGFLFGYLWTRLFLGGALRVADSAALGARISELERQTTDDARALGLVQAQLNVGSPEVAPERLRDAVSKASPAARTTISYQASDVRSKNWRDEDSKPRMERTIPIFRALIESDTRNRDYDSHGQLGYALKDKRNPDWVGAERELTRAIGMRGDWHVRGWLFLEFNRAICLIHMDAPAQPGPAGVSPNRDRILADLRAIATDGGLLELIQQDPVVREWMASHHVTEKSLRG